MGFLYVILLMRSIHICNIYAVASYVWSARVWFGLSSQRQPKCFHVLHACLPDGVVPSPAPLAPPLRASRTILTVDLCMLCRGQGGYVAHSGMVYALNSLDCANTAINSTMHDILLEM